MESNAKSLHRLVERLKKDLRSSKKTLILEEWAFPIHYLNRGAWRLLGCRLCHQTRQVIDKHYNLDVLDNLCLKYFGFD